MDTDCTSARAHTIFSNLSRSCSLRAKKKVFFARACGNRKKRVTAVGEGEIRSGLFFFGELFFFVLLRTRNCPGTSGETGPFVVAARTISTTAAAEIPRAWSCSADTCVAARLRASSLIALSLKYIS